jgi:lysophospholipase L1-like esterase
MMLLLLAALTAQSTFTPLDRGEDNFEKRTGLWFRPDLGKAEDVLPLKTRMWATRDSITGGVALKCVFEKGARGKLTFVKDAWPAGSAGITFYAKASKPVKVIVGMKAFRPVEIGTEWKKHDLTWESLETVKEKPEIGWQFVFKIVSPIEERTILWLDRVGVETVFDPSPKIAPQSGPDLTFSSKEMLYGAEHLAKTLARAKAKQPFKVIALGDSITGGAQCTRGSLEIPHAQGVPFLYFSHVARLWEQHFGYKGITPVQFGHGGWTAEKAMEVIDKEVVATAGPDDLVILQFGGNDMTWAGKSVAQWKAAMKKLIARARTKTDQILIQGATAGGDMISKQKEIEKAFKELVAEEKVAAADTGKLFYYRGEPFAWAMLANEFHPDFMGHLMMAEMIAPILTGIEKVYPE